MVSGGEGDSLARMDDEPLIDETLIDEAAADLGPIQMLALAFPGNEFRGEILPALELLKRDKIIRVLDLMVVRKDGSGNVMVTTGSDLDWEEATALGSYFGALGGFLAEGPDGFDRGAIAGAAEMADGHIFDDDDLFRITRVLGDNTSAAVVLIEHLWVRPLNDAIARAGGIELTNEWVPPEAVLSLGQSSDD
jgi:uncharacterized membrane protein